MQRMYRVELAIQAQQDVERHKKNGNKIVYNRILQITESLAIDPRKGIGKPKPLRQMKGDIWSRKIDDKHRLIYSIDDDTVLVIVLSAYGHYGDK
jgi:toxin YoeB